MNKTVIFRDLGRIPYKEAWDEQTRLFQGTIDLKLQNRKREDTEREATPNYLLFCEHNPVFTNGKAAKPEHLLVDPKAEGIDYFDINRGGDITYHGPGQLTGYPIFDLDNFFSDIGKYMRYLEEVFIRTIAEYGLKGERIPGLTGVWLDPEDTLRARKICALGVHTSRWVTLHGFGFNIRPDLQYFTKIIPCGIADKGVTSLEKELGEPVDFEAVKQRVKHHFSEVFAFQYL